MGATAVVVSENMISKLTSGLLVDATEFSSLTEAVETPLFRVTSLKYRAGFFGPRVRTASVGRPTGAEIEPFDVTASTQG